MPIFPRLALRRFLVASLAAATLAAPVAAVGPLEGAQVLEQPHATLPVRPHGLVLIDEGNEGIAGDAVVDARRRIWILRTTAPAGLPAQLIERRPDVRAAEQTLAATAANVDAARKATRFIRFCNLYNIPILFMEDTTGFLPGREQEEP